MNATGWSLYAGRFDGAAIKAAVIAPCRPTAAKTASLLFPSMPRKAHFFATRKDSAAVCNNCPSSPGACCRMMRLSDNRQGILTAVYPPCMITWMKADNYATKWSGWYQKIFDSGVQIPSAPVFGSGIWEVATLFPIGCLRF